MIDHYNAFISYKHAPEDNKVAEAVHKGLERFHIPRKIRKKMGIKRINRIFRDKDELPITSDLSDSISNALADSDYLIVICSTNTKESMWVPREIEYFLKNHSKKDIFTVLVNGEPYDVIPDILKYEDCVVKDENGEERTVRMPTEPLSCDFRTSLRKAKKTELPRLASGIIGCAYDELMNRRRQYRLKQFMAVVALVLAIMAAFSGYMYYSREEIHKNYLESLRNQSRYLAKESGNLLEKEQRITALQLALESLPKGEEDDRPVTAEAVKALTDATLAYEGNNGNNINAAWNYPMPSTVSDFRLNGDGKKIAIVDEGNVVGVWDTEDHKRILYFDDLEGDIVGIAFPDDETFILYNSYTVTAYDATSGEELWNYSLDTGAFISDDNLMLDEKSFYLCTYDRDYMKFDTRSGELLAKVSVPEKTGYEGMSMSDSKLSPDKKKIAFIGMGGWGQYAYGVLDIATKDVLLSGYSEKYTKDIEWLDNERFVVSSTMADMSGSMSFGSEQILSTDHSDIVCVDAADLSQKWAADFVCNGVTINSGFVKLGKDSVAYYSGNVCTVYDSETGTGIYSNNVNDSLIDVSDFDGNGEPTYITANGGYATPAKSSDEDAVYYNKYFADDLRQVAVSNGVYARARYAHEVIYYGVHVYDDQWTPLFDDATLEGSVADSYMDDNNIVMMTTDYKETFIDIYGLDEGAEHFRTKLEGDRSYAYKLLGIHNGQAYLGYENEDDYEISSIDIKTNEKKPVSSFKMGATFRDALTMKDGKFVYFCRTDDFKCVLVIQDIDTGDKKEISVPDDTGYMTDAPVYYKDEGMVRVCGDKDKEYIIDTESGGAQETEIPEGFTEASCFSDNCLNGRYAVSDGKKILLMDKTGKVSGTIRCPGVSPLGMSFVDNELIVLYSDGAFFRYIPDSGEFVMNVDATVYYNYNGKVAFDMDRENDLLYIVMDSLTDVVDIKSGVEITHILDCYGHDKNRDIFVTTAKDPEGDTKVGFYKRYSVNELIDKANDILKGAELSDELKSRYGIE